MKTIIKEIVIIVLLCLAICLLLGIVFYNYIPSNIIVPGNVEAYSTSNTIKEEIEEEIVEYPKENFVFEITDSDLTLYRKSQSYDEGKANPFASEETNTQANNNNNNTGTTKRNETTEKSNSESTTTNKTGDTNTTETFFQDTKLK